jgi:hypothetical protein
MRQLYQEYILQRIEAYKNSLSRGELLRLGDEAIAELETSAEEQFVLTEVMILDSVDRLIAKRLRLWSFNRWRKQWLTLREVQRRPSHWQIRNHHPVIPMLPRIEPGDHVVVVGTALSRLPYLLAAHDAAVTYLAADIATVERVETRIVTETLGNDFVAYVAQGGWLPDFPPIDFLIAETGALPRLAPTVELELLGELQARTPTNGIHLLAAMNGGPPLSTFGDLYLEESWDVDPVQWDTSLAQARCWAKRAC